MVAPRPTYENADSLKQEEEFALLLSQKFNWTFQKLPRKYLLDCAVLEHGRVVAFVELRVRSNPVDRYPTYMLALGKFLAADQLHRVTGLPVTFYVRWADAWGCMPLHTVNGPVEFGGRTDRGDWQDIEPVVMIPLSKFIIIRDS